MKPLSENATKVFNYVKSMDGENITAGDIADAVGLEKKSVDGIITACFQRNGIMERVPASVEDGNGLYKTVKFIRFTEEGRNFNPADLIAQAQAEIAAGVKK